MTTASGRGRRAPEQITDAELNTLIDQLTIAICVEAFTAAGFSVRALNLAAEAVLGTDQIAGSAETMLSPPGT